MGFLATITASTLAAIITTIGIYVINKFASWGKKNVTYFMAFASGVLISVSFMHIIPESFEMHTRAPVFLLVGFLMLHILHRFIHIFVCSDEGCRKDYIFGIIPAIGIGFHSLMDGVIYSVTFSVSTFTGVLAAVGMVLHEFPEGLVTFLILAKAGFSKRKAVIYAFLAAAVSTPLGTLISWPFISRLTPPVLGALLSISAGALIYVGATHLLPEVEEKGKKFSLIALAAGIAAAIVIIFSHGG